MLANRMALAIPAFVDLFTRHPQHLAFAITQIIDQYRKYESTESAHFARLDFDAKRRTHQGYLRRDFAFALAMTANGVATVIKTSAKTMTKPNMICLAFFGFSLKQDNHGPLGGRWP
jgi:hypothetical protein